MNCLSILKNGVLFYINSLDKIFLRKIIYVNMYRMHTQS